MAAGKKCEWETEVGPDGRLLTVGELGTDETDKREECEPERLEIIHRVIQQITPRRWAPMMSYAKREHQRYRSLLGRGEEWGEGGVRKGASAPGYRYGRWYGISGLFGGRLLMLMGNEGISLRL